jgi:hypothetical protein
VAVIEVMDSFPGAGQGGDIVDLFSVISYSSKIKGIVL